MANLKNRSEFNERNRSSVSFTPDSLPTTTPTSGLDGTPSTTPTNPKMTMIGSGPSVLFDHQFADKQLNTCREKRRLFTETTSSRMSTGFYRSHSDAGAPPKGQLHSYKDRNCKSCFMPYSDTTRGHDIQTYQKRLPSNEEVLHNTFRNVNNAAKSLYSEETNLSSQQAAIFFGQQSNTFINDVERNHNVSIEKEVLFGASGNKVVKQCSKEKIIWLNCAGKELIVQKNNLEDETVHVLVIPSTDLSGQRFSRQRNEIKMPVPPWVDGNVQEIDNLETVIFKMFAKVKDGKETKVAIRLEPLPYYWPFHEYMNCFVKCSVKWLLRWSDECPSSVTLLVESTQFVTMTDDCIEKCVAELQKGLMRSLPAVKVLQQQLEQTEADVLVNTTGPNMDLSVGNVSAALVKEGGSKLQKECRSKYPQGITPDKIAITGGYKLMCKKLFHITLPYYVDDKQCIESVRNAFKLCLETAVNNGYETIAFPVIGSGNLAYPIDLVRSEMFGSVERFKQARQDTSLKEVRFVVYPKDTELYEKFKKVEAEQKNSSRCQVKLKITGVKEDVVNAIAVLESKKKEICMKDIETPQQLKHENISKNRMDISASNLPDKAQYSSATGSRAKRSNVKRQFSWSKDAKHLDIYENGSLIIKVYEADILKVPTEGLVNAANEDLLHIGGIAGAIAKHAGERFQTESRDIVQKEGPLKVSSVVCTSGGNLDFKNILHAVGPRWRDYKPFTEKNVQTCADDLKQTFLSCLMVAESKQLKTLAIPTLSSGIFKVPKNVCVVQYAKAILDFDDKNNFLKEIHIVDMNSEMISTIHKIFYAILTERKPAPDCLREYVDTPEKREDHEENLAIANGIKANGRKDYKYSTMDKQEREICNKLTASQTAEVEDCVICMDKVTDGKKLKCGHTFCTECIDGYFRVKMVCPTCGKVCGTITGDQPPGVMRIAKICQDVSGYKGCKSIAITYRFQNGSQGPDHPKPGDFYKGISRTAFLPDTTEGRNICAMLKVAFERRLVFTIGTSRTTGQEGVITWNDIHHKTDLRPYTQFGYPDSTYLQRVQEELEVKGVTSDDIDDNFIEELKDKHFEQNIRV